MTAARAMPGSAQDESTATPRAVAERIRVAPAVQVAYMHDAKDVLPLQPLGRDLSQQVADLIVRKNCPLEGLDV